GGAAPAGAKDSATTAAFESVGEGGGTATATATRPASAPAKSAKATKGGKPKKQRSRKAKFTRRVLFSVLAFVGFCVAGFGIAYLLTPIPEPAQDAIEQGPTFLYSDGKTQIAKTGTNRDAVKLDQVPKPVRDAVIAAENRSFYSDPGVSVKGTVRAFWTTVSGEQLQGGSTITQQMVRNYYGGIGKERSVTRKLKEIMVALKVGRERDKDWILEQYLNTIFFGRDSYGVQAAAKAYFGKDISRLNAAEGAFLAASIQQPSVFGGDLNGRSLTYAEERWRAVLNNMVRDGAISQAEATALKFPKPGKQKLTDIMRGQRGYMVNVAKKELIERRGYTEDEINRSGLKITTTFDKRLMDALKESVTANQPAGMSKKIRTAAVSVDPETGQVVAFYGGRDYLDEALSSVFGDHAQPGSGFKPIVLATALDSGLPLSTTVDGSSPQYYGGTPVRNDSNADYGMVNLVTATQNSINTAYVNLGQKVGLDKVTEMAEKLGYTREQLTANGANTAYTFPLGVISAHPVQQAGVFATFASEGRFRQPFVVKAVADGKGRSRTFEEKGKRAFSEQTARDATYAMQRVVQSGTGRAANLPDGRPVAGKTGTTDQGAAIWFNGFIPQMATTVAMFRSDQKPLSIPGYGAYGGQLPAQIWRGYMAQAVDIKGFEYKSFGAPSSTPGSYDSGGYDDRRTAPPSREPNPNGRPSPPNSQRPPSSRPPSPPGGGDGDGPGSGDNGGDNPGGGNGDGPGGGDNGGDGPGGDNGGGGNGDGNRPDARG
ncbi:transglycosylase domain-containing protein, partial [Actinomadura kijaniata]|uniref:transglycosylase domain-containing protein n=1 Tax=Actinomadura kijaniata TaxID=46161 RepID=UPI003F1A172E